MVPPCHSLELLFRNPSIQRAIRLLAVFLLLLHGMGALAQAPAPDDTDMRNRALLLIKQNNFAKALPLLENLAEAHPTDFVILEGLGEALVNASASTPDPAARKQIMLRARSLFLHAKELGDKSDYLAMALEKLPENGEATPFSGRQEVDDAMREGEAAFGRSDFPAAIAAYQRAFQLDPKTYDAALFAGDVYYKMNQMDAAGGWFAKAIAIDPDRETAYRYWGDALLKDGKMEEAKAKFIDAVLCAPYQHTAWIGLRNWAKANRAIISPPRIDTPTPSVPRGRISPSPSAPIR
jgi:tetratricopeptide (TPR) repeat protein